MDNPKPPSLNYLACGNVNVCDDNLYVIILRLSGIISLCDIIVFPNHFVQVFFCEKMGLLLGKLIPKIVCGIISFT